MSQEPHKFAIPREVIADLISDMLYDTGPLEALLAVAAERGFRAGYARAVKDRPYWSDNGGDKGPSAGHDADNADVAKR